MHGKTILPLNSNPMVKAYLRHAHLFSVLSTDDAYLPWLYSGNYTQLVFDHDPNWYCPLDFYTPLGYFGTSFACPLLDAQWISRSVIDGGHGSIVPFLIENIEDGYHGRITVDEFYVPNRRVYRRSHFIHNLLVYGVDTNDGVFHIVGIVGYTASGDYAPSTLSFGELEEAFYVRPRHAPTNAGSDCIEPLDNPEGRQRVQQFVSSKAFTNVEQNRVWLVRRNHEAKFEFNMQASLDILQDYVRSANTPDRFASLLTFPDKVQPTGLPIPEKEDRTFGMSTYGYLRRMMEEVLRNERRFNFVTFHLLWEHKCVMLSRLEYFETSGFLDPKAMIAARYKAVKTKVTRLRLIMLRHALYPDEARLRLSIARLTEIQSLEGQVLEDTIDFLIH